MYGKMLAAAVGSASDQAAYAVPVKQYLTFCLGADEYAVVIGDVRAVWAEADLSRLRDVRYRGEPVELCDLRAWLGRSASDEAERFGVPEGGAMIVVAALDKLIGLPADFVRGVVTARQADLMTPPCVRTEQEAAFAAATLLTEGAGVTVLESAALAAAAMAAQDACLSAKESAGAFLAEGAAVWTANGSPQGAEVESC